jgi:hypothetical protein
VAARITDKITFFVFPIFGQSLFGSCRNTTSRTSQTEKYPDFKGTRSMSSVATLPSICRLRQKHLLYMSIGIAPGVPTKSMNTNSRPMMSGSRSKIVNVARIMIVNGRLAMTEVDAQSCKHVQVLSYLLKSCSCQLVTLELVDVGCGRLTHCTSSS